jgi:hypothetical protein
MASRAQGVAEASDRGQMVDQIERSTPVTCRFSPDGNKSADFGNGNA